MNLPVRFSVELHISYILQSALSLTKSAALYYFIKWTKKSSDNKAPFYNLKARPARDPKSRISSRDKLVLSLSRQIRKAYKNLYFTEIMRFYCRYYYYY